MIRIKGVDPGMIANNLEPFYPVHPGEIVKDEVEYRGITQRDLALEMGVSYSQLNEILNAKRPVSAEMALIFESVLNIDAVTLNNIQASYNMQIAKKNKSFMARLAKMRRFAAM